MAGSSAGSSGGNGGGAFGGAVLDIGMGPAVIVASFYDNQANGGNGNSSSAGAGGVGGAGGGGALFSNSPLSVSNSFFGGNQANGGDGGTIYGGVASAGVAGGALGAPWRTEVPCSSPSTRSATTRSAAATAGSPTPRLVPAAPVATSGEEPSSTVPH